MKVILRVINNNYLHGQRRDKRQNVDEFETYSTKTPLVIYWKNLNNLLVSDLMLTAETNIGKKTLFPVSIISQIKI